ncbi:hypothetical protein ACZ90_68205 [Streptomyces albus subsp. albus]|nr:hypothetical protein ACZ90_68205 [Streptomyces albus subsp. albus]
MPVTSTTPGCDRVIEAGPVRFPVRVRHSDAAWPELVRTLRELDPDRFLLVTDRGLPRAQLDRTARCLRSVAPTRVLRLPGPDPADLVTEPCVMAALGGTRLLAAAGRLAGRAAPGTRLVRLPTTLRAMSDGALSLDRPVDSGPAPSLVWAQLDFLDTLPPDAVRSGLSAIVRDTLAAGPFYYGHLAGLLSPRARYSPRTLAAFIGLCAELRSTLMRYDPAGTGPGAAFRYGEDLADAVRALGEGAPHPGGATAVGLLAAARIAVRLGFLDPADERAHRELVARWGVPAVLPAGIPPERVPAAMTGGTSGGPVPAPRTGPVGMVLLDALGQPHVRRGRLLTEVDRTTVDQELAGFAAPRVPTAAEPVRELVGAGGPGRP